MSRFIRGNKILSSVHDEFYGRLMNAESSSTGEQFWFRMLYEKYAKDPQLVSSFINIAEKSFALRHPSIPQIFRHGCDDDICYIVMESFLGESLSQVISNSEKISEERAVRIVVQICQALQYAKLAGTDHGCLSADSVFVNANDEIAVINFGCSEFFDVLIHDSKEKSALEYAGYLSPARLSGGDKTTNGDLYSIGILFFYMLTKQLPFKTERLSDLIRTKEKFIPNIREINSDVSEELAHIVGRLLASNPGEQFHSITHLVHNLAPEIMNQDALPNPHFVNDPVTMREKYQNYLDYVPPVFQRLVPTWVGSKRRSAVMMSIAVSILFITALVFILAQTGQGDVQNKDAVYQEYLSQVVTQDSMPLDLTEKISEVVPLVQDNISQTTESPVEAVDYENDSPVQKVDDQLPTIFEEGPDIEKGPDIPTVEQELPIENRIAEAFVVKVGVQGHFVKAGVFVNGNQIGTTNANGILEINSIEIGKTFQFRIEKDGFQTWEKRLRIDEQNQFGLKIGLLPKPDALRRFTVKDVEFADRVIIDNKLPSHQLPCEVDLPPGIHQFKYVESKSMFTKDTTLFLGMETSPEIFVDSKSLGSGIMSVVVQDAITVGYVYVSVDGEDKFRTTPLRLNLPVGQHQLIFFRDGFTPSPKDTTIIILPNREVNVRCKLEKNS